MNIIKWEFGTCNKCGEITDCITHPKMTGILCETCFLGYVQYLKQIKDLMKKKDNE